MNPDVGPRCGECRLGLGIHNVADPYCTHHVADPAATPKETEQ